MIKKKLTFVFICAFISAALLFSGCRSHSPEHKAEFMVDYIAETLDLNDEQREQLEEIKEEFIAKAREMHAQKEVMHAELMAELRKAEINPEILTGLIDRKRTQIDGMINLAMTRLVEFHKTLSPEQREKLVAKLEYFHQKHQDHWQ